MVTDAQEPPIGHETPARWSRLDGFVAYLGLLVLLMVGADHLCELKPVLPLPFWSVFDNAVHTAVGVAVVLPAVLWGRWPWRFLVVAALSASLLDLDHFVAAGSLSITDAVSIGERPATHSLLFSAAAGLGVGLLARCRVWGLVVFGALLSHLLRDSDGYGTRMFWPAESFHLQYWAYIALTLAVAAGFLAAGRLLVPRVRS